MPSKSFQVKDLIKILTLVDPELCVGRTDWYGDFVEMDSHDFGVDRNLDKSETWYAISPPDIGPEPD